MPDRTLETDAAPHQHEAGGQQVLQAVRRPQKTRHAPCKAKAPGHGPQVKFKILH